ncbi:hypothetical protein F5Y06DRAFT_308071 [Hypoxylon sp. FL0890]|nr:hypothetical protein F5Y06DRAFT_308071 [Hypoxylon sp. FL0890]
MAAAPGQKDQNKAGKSFDTGSTHALPSTDLASGIFEAPSAIQPEAQASKPVQATGGPLDKQAASITGRKSDDQSKKSEGETQQVVNSDGSVSHKPKDTAGAGASKRYQEPLVSFFSQSWQPESPNQDD